MNRDQHKDKARKLGYSEPDTVPEQSSTEATNRRQVTISPEAAAFVTLSVELLSKQD